MQCALPRYSYEKGEGITKDAGRAVECTGRPAMAAMRMDVSFLGSCIRKAKE